MSNDQIDPNTETIAETDNFMAWKADEPDGETTYYLQMGRATINFFQEEWDQFLTFLKDIDEIKPDDDAYRLEFDNVDVWMDEEDWTEFKGLAKELDK